MAAQITNVNKVSSSAGLFPHKHISEVKTAGGDVFTRSEVARRIENGEQSFYTYVAGSQASVVVVKCPHAGCSSSDYIRTTADSTTADNLLSLPSF
jgi:Protein of unknown function (DUF3892)